MNDTVVIYDRIRENLNKHTQLNISETYLIFLLMKLYLEQLLLQ